MIYTQDVCLRCGERMFKGWEFKAGSHHPEDKFLVCYNENCSRFKIRVSTKPREGGEN